MYIVAAGWLYVAFMMAVAEATHPSGTLLGAIVTFLLYGVGPVALVVYLMGTPARRKAAHARQEAQWQAAQEAKAVRSSGQPDAGGEASADAVTPVRKEP